MWIYLKDSDWRGITKINGNHGRVLNSHRSGICFEIEGENNFYLNKKKPVYIYKNLIIYLHSSAGLLVFECL